MKMYDNDFALIAAIFQNISSEKALGLYGLRPANSPKKDLHLTEKQALNLKFLHKTMKWNDLAKEFGINGEALRMQVSNALKKTTKTLGKAIMVASLDKSLKNNSISL